jgi:hypothetical protein
MIGKKGCSGQQRLGGEINQQFWERNKLEEREGDGGVQYQSCFEYLFFFYK